MQNYSHYFEYCLFAVHQETFKIILIYSSQKKKFTPLLQDYGYSMFSCCGGESKLTQMILEEECCSLLPAWLKLAQQTWQRILNLLSDHLTVKRPTKTTTLWLMRSYKHDQSKKEYVRLSIRNGLFNFWWGREEWKNSKSRWDLHNFFP